MQFATSLEIKISIEVSHYNLQIRMVSVYLDLAEMQAIRHISMTMEDWEERLNGF